MASSKEMSPYDLAVALKHDRNLTFGKKDLFEQACRERGVSVFHAYKLIRCADVFSREDMNTIGIAKLESIRGARFDPADLPLVLGMARELTEPVFYEWVEEKFGKRIGDKNKRERGLRACLGSRLVPPHIWDKASGEDVDVEIADGMIVGRCSRCASSAKTPRRAA